MVHLEHLAHNLCCSHPEIRVRLYPWDVDAGDVAESLWRYRPDSTERIERQEHIVVGYSYGGDRALKFVRELQFRGGCNVQHLWLCDPVRRWDWLPGVAGGLGVGRLRIPGIVERCHWFAQRNPRWSFLRSQGSIFQPASHKVVVNPKCTKLYGPFFKQAGHSYIDNDLEFRNGVLASVDCMLAGAKEAH